MQSEQELAIAKAGALRERMGFVSDRIDRLGKRGLLAELNPITELYSFMPEALRMVADPTAEPEDVVALIEKHVAELEARFPSEN
jgi:hypothetical protein